MKKTLPSIPLLLSLLLGGAAPAEERPPAKTSLDRLFDALTAVRRFKEVAISPDGRRVAWVEALPAKGDAPSSHSVIYVTELNAPDAAPVGIHTQPSLGASAPNQRSVTTFFRV